MATGDPCLLRLYLIEIGDDTRVLEITTPNNYLSRPHFLYTNCITFALLKKKGGNLIGIPLHRSNRLEKDSAACDSIVLKGSTIR